MIYTVTVTREDKTWFLGIDGLPDHVLGATDVARFKDIDLEARDLIAGLTDAEPDDFDIEWRYLFGDTDVTKLLRELAETSDRIDELELHRSDLRRELIKAGLAAEMPQSVIGDALSLSQQRVGQLVKVS